MIIELQDQSPNQVYFNFIQTLIPRPIAWVLSENENRTLNLAPFSYFNAVCSDPPLIMLSLGKKPDGSYKDTRVNIDQRHDFVVHIAHLEQMEAVNASSATLPAGESELERLGLEIADLPGSRLPRLAECRLAYVCERYDIQQIGNSDQSLILGLVKSIYIDDTVAEVDEKGRVKVHADRVNPLSRLGASEYMAFGGIHRAERPQ